MAKKYKKHDMPNRDNIRSGLMVQHAIDLHSIGCANYPISITLPLGIQLKPSQSDEGGREVTCTFSEMMISPKYILNANSFRELLMFRDELLLLYRARKCHTLNLLKNRRVTLLT